MDTLDSPTPEFDPEVFPSGCDASQDTGIIISDSTNPGFTNLSHKIVPDPIGIGTVTTGGADGQLWLGESRKKFTERKKRGREVSGRVQNLLDKMD